MDFPKTPSRRASPITITQLDYIRQKQFEQRRHEDSIDESNEKDSEIYLPEPVLK